MKLAKPKAMSHKLSYYLLAVCLTLLPSILTSQESDINVLIFYKTNGFEHGSIQAGISMIAEFGEDLVWNVDTSEDSAVFTTENLAQYDVVVWLNTSGNDLLTDDQQDAFEAYIQNNNGFVGVHAATDTYRNASWPWYNDLVGAIVQTNPNHTANNFSATMEVINDHPAVAHLGDSWTKNEEYYYWELNGGYLFEGNINLLMVEETGNQSYDTSRPTTWYKDYDGGRSFYTALGHNSSDYESDELFRTLMLEAIIWAADGETLNIHSFGTTTSDFQLSPNPTSDILSISQANFTEVPEYTASIYDLTGSLVRSKKVTATDHHISIKSLKSGIYTITLTAKGMTKKNRIIKN